MAWLRDQAERCGGCGQKRSVWERDHFAFVGHVERCPWCELIAEEHEHIASAADQGHNTRGLRVGLIPRAVAEKMDADVLGDLDAEGGL